MAASSEREMSSRIPVVVILGATGCGKSKLGIQIARKFGGEILSADSMQVYKGLDIVTNKVTAEERRLAPHHLLDVVEPLQRFTVLDFRNRALPIIEKLKQDGKLPVIVGGTNYYIESLLWKILVEDHEDCSAVKEETMLLNNAERTCRGGGGTLKEHVDRAEPRILKKKMLDSNSDDDRLLDVTCQKEVLDKCGFSVKCQKRVLECHNEVLSTKHQKVQEYDTCEMKVQSKRLEEKEGEDIDFLCGAPILNSTECHKVLDCSSADVAEAQSTMFSVKDCTDQEICQDKSSEDDMELGGDQLKPIIPECQNKIFDSGDMAEAYSGNVGRDQAEECGSLVDSAGAHTVHSNVKICYKVEGLKDVGHVSNNSQGTEVDSELVYERDRKRLLQEEFLSDNMEDRKQRLQDGIVDVMDEESLENVASPQLYERLRAVDPDMAQRLHPNNKRKIIRSLQVYAQTGRTHSAILRQQCSADGGSELGGPLRYPHSCILWLQCEQEVLDERLDLRVDAMLEQGLVQELLDFHRHYNKERLATSTEPDYTKGIFQSIGFKEFHEYLVLSEEDRSSEKGSKFFHAGVDALKLVTRRYARRQIRWITNRFLRRPNRQVPPVYGLDATDPCFWNECVLGPAVQIVESYLEGQKPAGVEPLPVIERPVKNDLKIHHCDVCDRMFVGDIQWKDHLHSKKHRKMLNRQQTHKD